MVLRPLPPETRAARPAGAGGTHRAPGSGHTSLQARSGTEPGTGRFPCRCPPARLRTRAGETPFPLASQGAECLSPVRPQQPFGLSPYLPLKETEAKFIFNPAQMYLYFTRICFLLCLMQRNKSLMGRLAMSSGRSFLTFYVGRGGAEGGLYHL